MPQLNSVGVLLLTSSVNPLSNMVKTYILAPNWTTAPPPDGPIKLGHLLDDLTEFVPINRTKLVRHVGAGKSAGYQDGVHGITRQAYFGRAWKAV